MSLIALKLQVPITPKRIRIEKPEVMEAAKSAPLIGVFFKVILFFSYFFSISSAAVLFFAHQLI